MKKAALKDPLLEVEMNANGFLHLKNFLSKDEVSYMLGLYMELHTGTTDNAMWNSLYDISREAGIETSEALLKILRPKFDNLFVTYNTPVATFMTKNNNDKSDCTLHRDFSVFDETQCQYRNIWIPLVDISTQNGALYVLRGSNHIFNYPLPMATEWPYRHLAAGLSPYAETIYAQAGDLVLYMDKTLHGSHINHSDSPRPVVHLGALPTDTPLLYYRLNKEADQVETYEVPYDFFFHKDFYNEAENYPVKSIFPYNPPILTLPEVIDQLKKYSPLIAN
jgi:hypothetical protein